MPARSFPLQPTRHQSMFARARPSSQAKLRKCRRSVRTRSLQKSSARKFEHPGKRASGHHRTYQPILLSACHVELSKGLWKWLSLTEHLHKENTFLGPEGIEGRAAGQRQHSTPQIGVPDVPRLFPRLEGTNSPYVLSTLWHRKARPTAARASLGPPRRCRQPAFEVVHLGITEPLSCWWGGNLRTGSRRSGLNARQREQVSTMELAEIRGSWPRSRWRWR